LTTKKAAPEDAAYLVLLQYTQDYKLNFLRIFHLPERIGERDRFQIMPLCTSTY
jgi:hypothetical protein